MLIEFEAELTLHFVFDCTGDRNKLVLGYEKYLKERVRSQFSFACGNSPGNIIGW